MEYGLQHVDMSAAAFPCMTEPLFPVMQKPSGEGKAHLREQEDAACFVFMERTV